MRGPGYWYVALEERGTSFGPLDAALIIRDEMARQGIVSTAEPMILTMDNPMESPATARYRYAVPVPEGTVAQPPLLLDRFEGGDAWVSAPQPILMADQTVYPKVIAPMVRKIRAAGLEPAFPVAMRVLRFDPTLAADQSRPDLAVGRMWFQVIVPARKRPSSPP